MSRPTRWATTRILREGIVVFLSLACVGPNPEYQAGSAKGTPPADGALVDGPDPAAAGAPGAATGGTGGGAGGSPGAGGAGGVTGTAGAAGGTSGGAAGSAGAGGAGGNDAGPIASDSSPLPDAIIDAGGPDAGPSSVGLVLHWRFDESTSLVANDSSPNGLNGAYQGNTVSHSAEHAPTDFTNVASSRFLTADQAVVLDSAFARLRPTTGITVSVWFRTSVTARTDMVSFNGDYLIRYMPPALEFVRRKPPNASGTQNFVTATAEMVAANDDRWHHVAGSSRVDQTNLWLDGVQVSTDPTPSPFLYTAGANRVIVGRAVDGTRTFTGWLDDFRVYDRVLTDDEIRALARRAH